MKAFQRRTRIVCFGTFELDLETAELQKNGRRVRLQDQPARLLALLASRPGELVTREEIQKELWEEGRFVEFDHAVNTAVKKVRQALEDDPERPQIIETLPRKGYRFIAAIAEVEVSEVTAEPAEEAAVPEPVNVPAPLLPPSPSIDADVAKPADKTGPYRLYWAFAAFVVLLALVAGLTNFNSGSAVSPLNPEMHLELMTPPTADPTSLAISPDGMKIVFVAISEGRSQLRLRVLESGQERSLAGTDGALFPFWSPNSRSIGFFADGALKRTEIEGGLPRAIAEAPAGRGGAWNQDDVILFTPNNGGPIFRVPASGDSLPEQLTEVSAGSHRHPRFLPDGRHFLYFVTGTGEARGVYLGDLEGAEPPKRLLAEADAAAEYASSNHVLFMSQGALFAQAFDPDKKVLIGDPARIAEQVTIDAAMNLAALSVSESNSLIYRTGSGGGQRQLIWFDRRGKEIERVGEPDSSGILGPSISPDGRHIALYRTVDGNSDIWLVELERGVRERFTLDSAGEVNPIWSPDGRRIAFSSNRDGAYDLYLRTISGSDTELVLKSEAPKSVSSWSPDGRHLLFRNASPESGYDIRAVPFDENGRPGAEFPVVQTRSEEREAEFSPSGKWIAYQSTASGRSEVYIQPFPPIAGDILLPISTNGGAQPRWGSDAELFYIALDGELMSVPIRYSADGREIRPGTPVGLFQTQIGGAVHSNDRQQYVVSPDGQRFLMNTLTETSSPITVILNWKG